MKEELTLLQSYGNGEKYQNLRLHPAGPNP